MTDGLETPPPTEAIGSAVVEVPIHVFPPDAAAVSNWSDDMRCELFLGKDGRVIGIHANVAALRDIARHCLTLAQSGQEGNSLHFYEDMGWFETEAHALHITRCWD